MTVTRQERGTMIFDHHSFYLLLHQNACVEQYFIITRSLGKTIPAHIDLNPLRHEIREQ